MSRIGKLPIHIPQGVTVAVSPDNTVTVKGPKGQLSQQVSADLTVTVEENEVHVARHTEDKEHKAQHGLYRALLHNMVVGVSEGARSNIKIALKYHPETKVSAIKSLVRVSKPGLRRYTNVEEMPRVLNGLGIAILSTSMGLMTDKEARQRNVGGEVLCYVY